MPELGLSAAGEPVGELDSDEFWDDEDGDDDDFFTGTTDAQMRALLELARQHRGVLEAGPEAVLREVKAAMKNESVVVLALQSRKGSEDELVLLFPTSYDPDSVTGISLLQREMRTIAFSAVQGALTYRCE
jgi:hypothetical protein